MDMSPTYCEFCFWDREIDCKICVKNTGRIKKWSLRSAYRIWQKDRTACMQLIIVGLDIWEEAINVHTLPLAAAHACCILVKGATSKEATCAF